MNKNEGLKKCLIVTMIIAIVSVVIAAAAMFLFQMVGDKANMMANFTTQLGYIKDAFVVPFKHDGSTAFEQAFTNATIPMVLGIILIVLSAGALAAIVAGIVLVIKRKKPAFSAFALVILATLFVSAIAVTYEGDKGGAAPAYFGIGYWNIIYGKISNQLTDLNVWSLVLAIVALVFTAAALVLMLVTYFNGLKYAKAPAEVSEGELAVEAQPVLAEEAVATEVVEETSEESFETTTDDYVPEVEPEPEEIVSEETIVEEEPAVEEEPKSDEDHKVEVNVNNNNAAPATAQPAIDTNSLASLLREVVRDIVRDELARNEVNKPQQPQQAQPTGGAQTITGATFGGPLVVQYFNGGINGVTPQAAAPAPAPAPAPMVEQKPVEAAPAEAPAAPVAAAAVAAEAVAEAPKEEEKVYERISFGERLLKSEKELQDTYSELKNEILSWGVKSRVSAVGDTFRLHKKMYIRITVAGKSLKLYFALDPAEYENSTIPVQDASNKAAYEEIPLVFKVKSALSVRRCKELIQATMEKDGLEQGEVLKVNWIKELKAEMKAGAAKKDEE